MAFVPVFSLALAASVLALPAVQMVEAPANIKPEETYAGGREISAQHARKYSDWHDTQMQPAFVPVGEAVLQHCSRHVQADMGSFGVVLVLSEEGRMHRYMTDAPMELGVCVAQALAVVQFPKPPAEGVHFAVDIAVGEET